MAIEQYKSQKVFIVGEVRSPGTYPLSGDMRLVEALARAGSTLPSAGGEAIIVHATTPGVSGPTLATPDDPTNVARVDLHELQNGVFSLNAALRDGDTIFIPRAESVYVFGQVRNPGAYALQQKNATVLQVVSIANTLTDQIAHQIVRINGQKKELNAELPDTVLPGDTIVVRERFF